jgi:hypothetical protein
VLPDLVFMMCSSSSDAWTLRAGRGVAHRVSSVFGCG